jgi:plastocyanin
MKWIVATALVATLVLAASAQAGSSARVVIRHQTHGCHAWSVNGNAYKASQAATVARGTQITFTNNDVMPHTLAQTSGPKVAILHAKMGHMSATAKVVFKHAGTYKFTTTAGEDYPGIPDSMGTIGKDNTLKLTIHVN